MTVRSAGALRGAEVFNFQKNVFFCLSLRVFWRAAGAPASTVRTTVP